MTAGQLRQLAVVFGQNVSDAVEKLDIALLRVVPQAGDKSVRHGTRGAVGDSGIGPGADR